MAALWLRRRGWVILARNWRCREGEVDLVAHDPDGVTVVCEVKCRRGDAFGDPLESITREKVRRLRRLAAAWASSQDRPVGVLRVDAVGVRTYADGTSAITHVRGLEP